MRERCLGNEELLQIWCCATALHAQDLMFCLSYAPLAATSDSFTESVASLVYMCQLEHTPTAADLAVHSQVLAPDNS